MSGQAIVSLAITPRVIRVGEMVTATACSAVGLTHVAFSVVFGDTVYPFDITKMWKSGGGLHYWRTEFRVNDPGEHSVRVVSDSAEASVSFEVMAPRGKPREPYERTYVLLPPKADAEWARAVVEATWDEHRYTLGGSADDAGIGDLDVRRVMLVNAAGWGGERVMREWYAEWYPGVDLSFVNADSPEQLKRVLGLPGAHHDAPLQVGLHDEAGGADMASHGMKGVCLVHAVVQREARKLDFRPLQDAGITVICRLGWGYADGTGTLPRPADKEAFIDAAAGTILQADGVDYFHVGNEPNNPGEWPGGPGGYALTADYVVEIYNALWYLVGKRAKLGPPPIDPYFGPGSDNGDYWAHIIEYIAGADAIFLHAKTQSNLVAQVWSMEKFADEPLWWQYLHLRTVETGKAIARARFWDAPVFVTECNPQRRGDGSLGWEAQNLAWIHEACAYLREQEVAGVAFYRYELAGDQAGFGLEDKPVILEAIRAEAGD